jgi:hypothetical protein
VSSTKKILGSEENLSTAALDDTGVFLYLDLRPIISRPLTIPHHSLLVNLSVRGVGAWWPLPLTPNFPPKQWWSDYQSVNSTSKLRHLPPQNEDSGIAVKMLFR